MKIYLSAKQLFMLVALLCMHALVQADDKMTVFACEPEWGALAAVIGGDHVDVVTAITAQQNPHYVRAKPSLIANMRKARLVICSGAGLETGWLPLLLQKTGSLELQPGNTGHLMAASTVPLLEVSTAADRSMGDVHPEGNPHVHLDPHNILRVAVALSARLSQLDPAHAAAYKTQLDDFTARWSTAMQTWETRAQALKGMPVIIHHKSWSYLVHWLALREVATLEPKPGLPPTTAHLESLLQVARSEHVQAILRTPFDPADGSEWLAQKTGIPALELPYTVGGDVQTTDLFLLFDNTLAALEQAHAHQHRVN